MSSRELRRELQRLSERIADVLAERDASESLELLQRLGTVAQDLAQKLAQAEAQIAELKRELFGPKAERLSPEQEDQLSDLIEDMHNENQRPAPVSDAVLEEEDPPVQKLSKLRRQMRHPLPAEMEIETITIEPELAACACCGKMPVRIGEEVSEEIDRIPARLIRRRTIRPKYACPCGVTIAALPRLIPQSRLGLGLAVYIVLARFDDHLSYYRLEQQFRERHGIEIPRQQMVQWIEHIATWLQPLVERMWQAMHAGGYLQVDETPVKVLDPDVRGKAAQGYLWFYAVPGGDVLIDFDCSRGLEPVRRQLAGLPERSKQMPTKSTNRFIAKQTASSASGASLTRAATRTKPFKRTSRRPCGSSHRFARSTASKMKSAASLRPNDMPCVRSGHPKSGIRCSPEPKSFAQTYCRKAHSGRPSITSSTITMR